MFNFRTRYLLSVHFWHCDEVEVGKFIILVGNSISTKVSDSSVSHFLKERVFGFVEVASDNLSV